MKKSYILTAIMAVSMVALPATVLADEVTTTTTNESTETTTKPEAQQSTPESAERKAAELKKRLEENKTKLKTRVDEAAKRRITARCKPAQALVKGAEKSATAVTENRTKAYTRIGDRVQSLIDRLKAANIDTAELEAVHAMAKTKAETLATTMKSYQQTLADLQAMDCVADPTAFAATLETARTQRETIKTQANELRTYLSTNLKQEINKIRAELQSNRGSSSSSGNDATETTGGAQ